MIATLPGGSFSQPVDMRTGDLPVLTGVVDFVARPTVAEMSAVVPEAAAIKTAVFVECQVKPDGRLSLCKITGQSDKSVSFQDAVMALTPRFRVDPESVKAIHIAHVNFTLGFAYSRSGVPLREGGCVPVFCTPV